MTPNLSESMPSLPRLSHELSRRERLLLVSTHTVQCGVTDSQVLCQVRRSTLGEGINIRDDRGPQYTGRAVIADVDSTVVRVLERKQTTEEVIVSYHERAAAYARAGWAVRALDTSSPWVNSVIAAPSGHEGPPAATPCSSTPAVWVTGRYLHSGYQFVLPGARALSPHAELLAAVNEALAEPDLEERKDQLTKVWECYGHVYVDCVEMGGMYHATAVVEPSKQARFFCSLMLPYLTNIDFLEEQGSFRIIHEAYIGQ